MMDVSTLAIAVNRYFDLMYDCDVSRFWDVFARTAVLHGIRDGEMRVWSATEYYDILSKRSSPRSQNAPRQDSVLFLDVATPFQGLAKVRLRILDDVFVDCLTYHVIDKACVITGKGYHLVR